MAVNENNAERLSKTLNIQNKIILLSMYLSNQNKEIIKNLCEIHNVDKLYLFGSATTTKFNNESDIDFLVKFKSFDLKLYFINYLDLNDKLKNLLHREIDLVEEQTLKNPYLIRSIEENKELVYG